MLLMFKLFVRPVVEKDVDGDGDQVVQDEVDPVDVDAHVQGVVSQLRWLCLRGVY